MATCCAKATCNRLSSLKSLYSAAAAAHAAGVPRSLLVAAAPAADVLRTQVDILLLEFVEAAQSAESTSKPMFPNAILWPTAGQKFRKESLGRQASAPAGLSGRRLACVVQARDDLLLDLPRASTTDCERVDSQPGANPAGRTRPAFRKRVLHADSRTLARCHMHA